MNAEDLRNEILRLTEEYWRAQFGNRPFVPGESSVKYGGRVFDARELVSLVDASLEFWLTEGRFARDFTQKIADFLGVSHVLLVNSGSSANLLALSALTSEKLGDKRLRPGDRVITVAAGFPSTVAPIYQTNLQPVFVDVAIPTYNIDVEMMQRAVTPRTRCIFVAHTLGNPFNIDAVLELAQKHDLWVIEDNCDSFGSRYAGRFTGTFGHIATFSFYPAHHITTGEGGAVATKDDELARLITSFRDWGRDCHCAGGANNTCKKRFTQQFGTLPLGYDHKYVYSELGYNFKMTDLQAAIGYAQMDKLPEFTRRRKANFQRYLSIFKPYEEFLILPEATERSDPSWFGFLVAVREDAPFGRDAFAAYLTDHRIETRYLFAGNIIRQPAFMHRDFIVADHLNNSDFVMNNALFLGTYPGMTTEMLDYTESVVASFMKR